MNLKDLLASQLKRIAALIDGPTSYGALRQVVHGRRKMSAEMAIEVERAAKRIGLDVPREENCAACGGCEYAAKSSPFARKKARARAARLW
jgi:DNA-binding transcriptional regulator YdaS (Cro superfamily)